MAIAKEKMQIDRMEAMMSPPSISFRTKTININLTSELMKKCIEAPSLLDKIEGKHIVHFIEGDEKLLVDNKSIADRLREKGENVLCIYWKEE